MDKLEIYLIRHGKTHCNENKLYCGSSDVELSENGINEINELKNSIKYPSCDMYFTSGAKRANMTIETIYKDIKYNELKEFWEYNFGDFEMKSYEILKNNSDYIAWITDNSGKVVCPNGESKKQYRERIEKAFEAFVEQMFNKGNKSALLLCHGGTIGTILELFYDNSKSFYEHQPQCGRGYKLTISKDNSMTVDKIELI